MNFPDQPNRVTNISKTTKFSKGFFATEGLYRDGSTDQGAVNAMSEKISALKTGTYLQEGQQEAHENMH